MNADVGAEDSEVCEHDMLLLIFPTQGHTKGGSWGASEIT